MENTTIEKRNIGVDLLRIVATFMIVLYHVFQWEFISISSPEYVWGEAFLIGCFNVIALIAGYTLCTGKYKLGRVLRVWVMGIFYSILFHLVQTATRVGSIAWTSEHTLTFFTDLVKSFFPVITSGSVGRYWFFTAYMLVLLLVPVFNYAIEKMNRKFFFAGLVFFGILFSVIQFAADPWGINDGKSAFWIGYLYFVGAYYKKYGFPIQKWWKNLLVYVCASAAIAGLWYLAGHVEFRFWNPRYAEYLRQYCSVFALIASAALLALFAQLPIKRGAERTMRYFSAHTLGIYFSHGILIGCTVLFLREHPWSTGVAVLDVLLCALVIFFLSFIVEAIRRLLFRVSRIDALVELVGNGIQKKLSKE